MKADAQSTLTPRGTRLGHVLGVVICLASAWLVLNVGEWLCDMAFGPLR